MKDLLIVVTANFSSSGLECYSISATKLLDGSNYSKDNYEDVCIDDTISDIEDDLGVQIDVGGTETDNVYQIDLDVEDLDDTLSTFGVSKQLNKILDAVEKHFI